MKFAPSRNGRNHSGYFKPKNIEKYVGDLTKIVYRSGWEFKFMMFCDTNPKVLSWSSEPFRIPYISPVDKDKFGNKKRRNYIVDFWMKVETTNNEIKNYLIEIKPGCNLIKPVLKGNITNKRLDSYNKALSTYLTNQAKFEAAQKYCETKKWLFAVVTEEKHPWLHV